MTAIVFLLNVLVSWVALGFGVYILGGIVALGWFLVIVGSLRVLLKMLG